MLIAEVILPVPVRSNFDYKVPVELASYIEVGMRALVNFGKDKVYTGVIKALREVEDEEILGKLKRIQELPDDRPVLRAQQMALFEWMASYYFCTEGEVLKASLPAGLKLESEQIAEYLGNSGWEDMDLSDLEHELMGLLRLRGQMTFDEIAKIWERQNPIPRLRKLQSLGLIRFDQRLREGYKAKTVPFLELADAFKSNEALNEVFGSLRNAPRQEEVLMLVAEQHLKGKPIRKKELRDRLDEPDSAIKALVDKGILAVLEVPVDRLEDLHYRQRKDSITLSAAQEEALAAIRTSFSEHPQKPVLLHGVTGSGKTHLYIEAIRDALAAGQEVLYLLPEIAITQQIIDKVKSEFGADVGVYHSRFNDAERVEIWQKVVMREYKIVIGVRSAIFLPFLDLGLIIVDEEHDQSFKQDEPSPRYQARDVAVYASRLFNCRVLLGSATPSFESFHNAREGRYTLVELKTRAINSLLPTIELVNMAEQNKKKLAKGYFSQPLLQQLKSTLERREQAILFQNRRGFVPWLTCQSCGTVPKCINCDISLTYHKGRKQLRCHYCGYTDDSFDKCGHCGSYEMRQIGIGTERIEEELQVQFPEARIARMDLDTTRTRHGFLKLIRSFEAHEIDILVGTQMVSKGLDFGNVTLVGVIDADLHLNFPEFRAHERAYQLLTQVSGRAGRSTKPGRVLIQTFKPSNTVLQHLQGDFGQFFDSEIRTRSALHYPPYSRLIRIELRHKNQSYLDSQAIELRNLLVEVFGDALLGPEYPSITRLRNEYRQVALLKLARKLSVPHVREVLKAKLDAYYRQAPNKTLRVMIDVDPG